MIVETVAENSVVGIVDDDADAAAAAEIFVKRAGYRPVVIPLSRSLTLDDMLSRVTERNCSAVICDHRLNSKFRVGFDGARLAGAINTQLHVPAVLRTTFARVDSGTSIRLWRHEIPRVLEKGDRNASLSDAFEFTIAELNGSWALERQPCSAVIEVVAVDRTQKRVDLIVGAWRTGVAVAVPIDQITRDIAQLSNVRDFTGKLLSATVNCHASHERDLYFYDFKLAEEPPDDWMSV